MKFHALWLSASVIALGWGGSAAAQSAQAPAAAQSGSNSGAGKIGEVVVTAERRTTNLQKTAIAATVINGKDLSKQGVFTVDQLQFVSPSLTVNNFGQGNDVDIRGIGKGEHNTQTSTGVITYRDGAATFPGYIQEEPYFDVAGVEVLRGPQGTFSGQNATGGAIIVNTNNPVIGGGHDGYLLGHYGNYNDTGLQGAVNLPISDTLAARVAFDGQYRDTFYHISGPWTGDPNVKWGAFRLSLLWKPDAHLSVLAKLDYDYLNNGGYFGDAIINPQTGKVNGTGSLFNFANNWHTSAIDQFVRSTIKIDYVTDGGVDFRSVTSGATSRSAWTGDIDGTAWTGPTAAAPTGSNYMIDEGVDTTTLSQEFNVISPSKGPLTWILGAYYGNITYNFPYGGFEIGVPHGVYDEDLNGTNRTYNWAVFGQVSYDLPAGFQLQVGARYTNWFTKNVGTFYIPELIPYGYSWSMNGSEKGNNLTGKVTLNWNLNEHNFLYAFVATGAKPGGLNTPLYFFGGYMPPPFKQEYVTDYEIGWKSSLFDNHVRLQVGAYDNSFQHFQVIIPLPNDPSFFSQTEENVPGRTKLYGVEGSVQAVFGDFSLNAGLGLEHTELGTFYSEDPRVGTDGHVCNPTKGPASAFCINLGGHPQTYAPNFTFNLGASYNFHLNDGDTLTPGMTYSHISDQWGTLFDNRAQGDYLAARDIVGASLAWTHNGYVVTGYAYNLTDDHYVSALLSPIRLAGAPRQFGVSVMKTF
ncbi:TonB-dependent receptor [Phenylobacterium montanum]|uniref:TonB-dependent receptor n=1 Tax=Phenylobacterium montanum TaxID=2823693 RepID=A0A975IVT4_9CAUL|nr:TonB-dependent receptor [Caulobacter sp. S6]QUD89342.1 TonB-dependent receptor [Caulobacter sp. S6]